MHKEKFKKWKEKMGEIDSKMNSRAMFKLVQDVGSKHKQEEAQMKSLLCIKDSLLNHGIKKWENYFNDKEL